MCSFVLCRTGFRIEIGHDPHILLPVFDSRPECHFVRSFIILYFSFLVIRPKTFHCLFQRDFLRERPRRFAPTASAFPEIENILISLIITNYSNTKVECIFGYLGREELTRKRRIEVKRLSFIFSKLNGAKNPRFVSQPKNKPSSNGRECLVVEGI